MTWCKSSPGVYRASESASNAEPKIGILLSKSPYIVSCTYSCKRAPNRKQATFSSSLKKLVTNSLAKAFIVSDQQPSFLLLFHRNSRTTVTIPSKESHNEYQDK
uniref:Ovule protein n=1 Tax=Heterorhabditis bacteriophora TaxID=37862 RepID=A0A1I7WZV1_HETBA